jgi:hypothetical protein
VATDAQQREWMDQWRGAASALRDERRRRLAAMTDEQARGATATLLDMASRVPVPAARLSYSGLVEQQAILHRRHLP